MQRLTAVQAELQALKTANEAKAGEALLSLGRYTPFPFLSWWVRLVLGLPQRVIVTVTTNVPGPRQPLYAMGRRLLEILPYVPIATTVRTGVSIVTYCGNVTFGITGDFAASPDLDVLAHGIEDGVPELLAAARHHPGQHTQTWIHPRPELRSHPGSAPCRRTGEMRASPNGISELFKAQGRRSRQFDRPLLPCTSICGLTCANGAIGCSPRARCPLGVRAPGAGR